MAIASSAQEDTQKVHLLLIEFSVNVSAVDFDEMQVQ